MNVAFDQGPNVLSKLTVCPNKDFVCRQCRFSLALFFLTDSNVEPLTFQPGFHQLRKLFKLLEADLVLAVLIDKAGCVFEQSLDNAQTCVKGAQVNPV